MAKRRKRKASLRTRLKSREPPGKRAAGAGGADDAAGRPKREAMNDYGTTIEGGRNNLDGVQYHTQVILGKSAVSMDAEKHYAEGLALAAAGDNAGAAASYERAIREDPSVAVAHYSLGTVKRRMNDFDGALACFRQATKVDSNFALAHTDMALELNRAGRHQEALESVDRALELDPGLGFTMFCKGTILSELDRHQKAVSCFDAAMAVDRDEPLIHFHKGMSLLLLDRYDQAIECFERSLELDPGNMQARLLMQGAKAALEMERAVASTRGG